MDNSVIALVVGIIIALVFVVAKVLFGLRTTEEYDERQLVAQGKAYKFSFFALMLLLAGYAIYWSFAEQAVLTPPTAIVLAICCASFMFAVICVFKEAYIPLNSKHKTNTVIFALFGIVNIISAIDSIVNGEMLVDGVLGFPVVNLVFGVMSMVLAVSVMIKAALDKKENNNE